MKGGAEDEPDDSDLHKRHQEEQIHFRMDSETQNGHRCEEWDRKGSDTLLVFCVPGGYQSQFTKCR